MSTYSLERVHKDYMVLCMKKNALQGHVKGLLASVSFLLSPKCWICNASRALMLDHPYSMSVQLSSRRKSQYTDPITNASRENRHISIRSLSRAVPHYLEWWMIQHFTSLSLGHVYPQGRQAVSSGLSKRAKPQPPRPLCASPSVFCPTFLPALLGFHSHSISHRGPSTSTWHDLA